MTYLEDLALLRERAHASPHRLLGLKKEGAHQKIRIWRPGSEKLELEVLGKRVLAEKTEHEGFFTYTPPRPLKVTEYRVVHRPHFWAHDPYAFAPTLEALDLSLFQEGRHYHLYRILGAHRIQREGVLGTRFAVWAPHARAVSVVGDFNEWDDQRALMHRIESIGVWELFLPGVDWGERYRFAIHTQEGTTLWKSDPFAFQSEKRPRTASIVCPFDQYVWKDQDWMKKRSASLQRPVNIYEVHLASWADYGKEFPSYQEIARDLARYCVKMGFTHVEILPILEHPLDESWGYQISGFFCATSRYGSLKDFQEFVDLLHQEGVGVILDWVPGHFLTDHFGLRRFDGTPLYEPSDDQRAIHPKWKSAIFNYASKQVENFLIASALFWLEWTHVDALRVDAVSSLIYLDYARHSGEWTPNAKGGNLDYDAIAFIQHLNTVVHQRFPDVWMIAEESSPYEGVTRSVEEGGLGFDLKWNLGWIHDTFEYFRVLPEQRKEHHKNLTFGLFYTFSEQFLSVLSHDGVAHGRKSLLSKMPGSKEQQFANLRLLYSYTFCYPGKKLLFMGGELADPQEWCCKNPLDWSLLEDPLRQGFFDMVKTLNHFYLKHRALWEDDFSWEGFEWLDCSNEEQSIIAYLRKAKEEQLVCIHHFGAKKVEKYFLALDFVGSLQQVFYSEDAVFVGSSSASQHPAVTRSVGGFQVDLQPLSTLVLKVL